MKITIPQSWRELTEWQLDEIADLYLNADPADFSTAFQKMIFILLQSEPSSAERTKLYRILGKVSVEALAEHADFLMKTTNLHFFPEVDGLTKPADRLASIIVKHFAVDDKFLHGYEEDKSESTCDNLWLPCRHCEASQPTYPAGGRCGHRRADK